MDDDYWTESYHKGFDFDEDWAFQSLRNNEGLDQLKCDGLNETVENDSKTKTYAHNEISAFFISNTQEVSLSPILNKKHSTILDFQVKTKITTGRLRTSDAVKHMVLGLNYTLEPYKGRKEKIELLDEAVKCHDGNAIIAVILFLRRTLKKPIFQKEILSFPDATNMYLSYLEEIHEIDELTNMLLLMGKGKEAAMLKYKIAVTKRPPENKLKWLNNCLSTHFQPDSVDEFVRRLVQEHHDLLCTQISIQNKLELASNETNVNLQFLEKLTRSGTIVDSSVMNTVILSFLYQYNLSQNCDYNPIYFKERYHLTDRQYTWVAVRTLSALKRWEDIENLFISKSWLGGKKMKCCIGFSRVLEVLSAENAPSEILNKYIYCIENEEEKLNFAKKYQCHSVVIEILKTVKDKQGLLEYKSTLPSHSVDFFKVTEILKNPLIKWKN